ncbi:MAG: homoserine dehydrogenase [Bacillota bacterium]|nr:homoserine dehydrogenase [Bacillota bacterium]
MKKDAINVGIIGAGTVGGGAAAVLVRNAELIAHRAAPIRLAAIAELDRARGEALCSELSLPFDILTDDWLTLVGDPDIDIIVETIGGVELAHQIISSALKAGKSVVTANKDLMATHGGELLNIAGEMKTDLFFEAAVAGGIPIIQSVKEGFAGNRIGQIMGIVNGTTNYILTRMSESGADYAEALAEAQALGYAEADPTSDVAGHDAARKMAILASIAFNSRVSFDMVPCEGIDKISAWDIAYAEQFGYAIKMLGIARSDGQLIDVRVHPLMISKSHPLAAVRDSYNAIFVQGDALGSAMLYGRGAGALPTGSAIAGDIINATRNILHDSKARWGCTCHLELPVLPLDETLSKYYVRICVFDRIGVFAELSEALTANNISMDSVMQKRRLTDDRAEIVLITHQVRHADMMAALNDIERLDCVCEVSDYIRVEDESI